MNALDEETQLRQLLAPLATVDAVQRRQTHPRRRRLIAAVVIAVAACTAVAAMAATETWIFKRSSMGVFGAEPIQFHGNRYTLGVQAAGDGRSFFALVLVRGNAPMGIPNEHDMVASAAGGSVLWAPGVPQSPGLPANLQPSGPAFGAINYDHDGGQIWFGDARPNVTRIEITDNHGRDYESTTSTPPSNIKLAFRFWAIALPHSTGATIAGYDQNGKLVQRHPIWGLVRAMYLH